MRTGFTVTDDPAFLDSYAFQWLAELVRPNRSHYMPRPWVVVLSGSTEEVQAVTKICNKHTIKIKPISTGWYHWAAPMKDDEPTVQFDLRRMDCILEIDVPVAIDGLYRDQKNHKLVRLAPI